MLSMPSKNVFSILIICLGLILAVWIVNAQMTIGQKKIYSVGVGVANSEPENNILNGWDTFATTTESLVGQDTETVYENDGTITGQLAQDFFSQYFQLTQGGQQQLTDEEASQLAQNTLANGNYTQTEGTQYSYYDLKISKETSVSLAQQYGSSVEQILTKNSPPTDEDVLTVLNRAVKSGNESDFAPIDTIIKSQKQTLADMLKLQIPSDAVIIHLNLINSISNLLSNTEAMRNAITDPIRGFAALSQYRKHIADMKTATVNINSYLDSKK